MREKTYTPPPLVLNKGYSIDLHFKGFDMMERDDDNWEHHCNYQLLPGALEGHHRVLQLDSMQFALAERPTGGIMYNAGTTRNCLAVGIVEACSAQVCFDRIKLRPGDLVFFDDTQTYNFMSSGSFRICALTMQKEKMGALLTPVSEALGCSLNDAEGLLSKTLRSIWKRFSVEADGMQKSMDFIGAEEEIRAVLLQLFNDQTPQSPRLTKGEEVALDIRNRIFRHMDGKISVQALAKMYQISEKTLQNSFKSLFGFTPKQFLQKLKLNHVHYELKISKPAETTVLRTAQKWGFDHMGRFSKYYKDLFGECPSTTLQTDSSIDAGLSGNCASRKEEII